MKLSNDWYWAFTGAFETYDDVVEFILERMDTSDFEDSYMDMGGYGEPNECVKITAEDKKNCFYDFMGELMEKAGVDK